LLKRILIIILSLTSIVGCATERSETTSGPSFIKNGTNTITSVDIKEEQIDFSPGVLINLDDVTVDSKEGKILSVVINCLHAIVAKNSEAFATTMESENLTDAFQHLFLPEVQYRFLEVENIYPLGDDPNRMNVIIRLERKQDDQAVEEKSFTFTLRPKNDSKWKIASID
jgi:hypothetical protein